MTDLRTPSSDEVTAVPDEGLRRMTSIWIATAGVLFVILAILGWLMRVIQAHLGEAQSWHSWYYAIVTLHGAGMIATTLMGLASLLSWVLRDRLPMSAKVSLVTYVMTMTAIVLVLITTLVGRFGPGWTFLYPLPTTPGPGGAWDPVWAYPYYIAIALVCLAFALWGFDVIRAGIEAFGNPGRMFGVDIVFGDTEPTDPKATTPSVVAAGIMAFEAILTAIPGAIIIVMLLLHGTGNGGIDIQPLFAKNMIYFVGHMMANFAIYLGAGIMYAVIPRYAHRPWPAAKTTIVAWWCIVLTIIFPYFHHLYMDFANPAGLAVVGNIASYASALPSATVTIFGAILIVFRSGIKWSPAPLLLYAGLAGWSIGGIGALIDSTPMVNSTMHNTMWVPGHFHTYMALGALLFMLGGVYHYAEQLTGKLPSLRLGGIGSLLILVGGWIVVISFFVMGAMSVIRRVVYADIPRYTDGAAVGAVGASIAIVGLLIVAYDLLRLYLPAFARRPAAASVDDSA